MNKVDLEALKFLAFNENEQKPIDSQLVLVVLDGILAQSLVEKKFLVTEENKTGTEYKIMYTLTDEGKKILKNLSNRKEV